MNTVGEVLHALRLLGYADTTRIAARAALPTPVVEETLLDTQAAGQVTWSQFDDDGGWSLTEAGRALNDALLAADLDPGTRNTLESAMAGFEPLNQRVCDACTRWQLRETNTGDAVLSSVLVDLSAAVESWAALEDQITLTVPRFAGYHSRLTNALTHAPADPDWITGLDRDSAHRVWFELHEDLLATLGRSR